MTYDPAKEETKQKKKGRKSDLFTPRSQAESENEMNTEEVNIIVNGIKNELSSQAERISNLEDKLNLILEAVTGKPKKEKKKVRIASDKKSKRNSERSMRSEKGSNVPTPSGTLKSLSELPEVIIVPPSSGPSIKHKKTLEKPIDGSSSSSSDSDD